MHFLLRPAKGWLAARLRESLSRPNRSSSAKSSDLRQQAQDRLRELQGRGVPDARLYDPTETSVRGTHAIFILRGDPRTYNLPPTPEVPTVYLKKAWTSSAVAAGLLLGGTLLAFLFDGGNQDERSRACPSRQPLDLEREHRLDEIRREAKSEVNCTDQAARPPGAPFPQAAPESGYYGIPLLKEPPWTWEYRSTFLSVAPQALPE